MMCPRENKNIDHKVDTRQFCRNNPNTPVVEMNRVIRHAGGKVFVILPITVRNFQIQQFLRNAMDFYCLLFFDYRDEPFSIHAVAVAEFERSESADPFDETAECIQIRETAAHCDFGNRKVGSAEQRARLFYAG